MAAPSHTATAFVAASSVAAPPFIAQVTDNVILPENKKYENTSELIISANVRAIESSRSLCCSVCSKMDHSVLNNADIATAAADCNAPDRSVSYYIVSHEKLCPPRCSFFSKFFDHFLFLKELHSFNCVKERYRLHFRARRGICHGVWDKISQKLAIFCKLNSNDVVYPKRKPNSRPIWQNRPTVWLFLST